MASTRSASSLSQFAGYLVLVILVVLWQLADNLRLISFTYIPSPLEILGSLTTSVTTGSLWSPAAHTLLAVLTSWAIAVFAGVTFGVAAGYSRWVWNWSMSTAQVLRTVPAVALVPVALLLFGYSIQSEIVVATFVAVWPVIISTAIAARRTPPRLIDVARSFGLAPAATAWKLLLPAALPQILVAARLAMTLALILVVLTEMIGVPDGLGYELTSAQQSLRPADMWAFLIIITVMGLLLQVILTRAAQWAAPGLSSQLSTRRTR